MFALLYSICIDVFLFFLLPSNMASLWIVYGKIYWGTTNVWAITAEHAEHLKKFNDKNTKASLQNSSTHMNLECRIKHVSWTCAKLQSNFFDSWNNFCLLCLCLRLSIHVEHSVSNVGVDFFQRNCRSIKV